MEALGGKKGKEGVEEKEAVGHGNTIAVIRKREKCSD